MSAKAHDSAGKQVSGTALFIDDTIDSSYKHIAIGYSTIACGTIESIDLTAVRSSDGVVDVITVEDIPGHTDIGPVFKGDPLLTSDRIEFFGQAIFAVLHTGTGENCSAASRNNLSKRTGCAQAVGGNRKEVLCQTAAPDATRRCRNRTR